MRLKNSKNGAISITWESAATTIIILLFVAAMIYFIYQSRHEMYASIDRFFG